MISKQSLGVILFIAAFLIQDITPVFNFLRKLLKPFGLFLLIASLAFISLFLIAGCTTTKPIYVPAECPKPQAVSPYTDYLKKLPSQAKAPDFVRACLATRLSCHTAYITCERQLNIYR